ASRVLEPGAGLVDTLPMTAIRVARRALRRDRADRWSAAVRGAAVAVVLVGVVGSALLAQGWKSTVDHQRDERLDRTATARTVTIAAPWPTTRAPCRRPVPCGWPRTR
ncbi:MAG: hypothetical protein ABW222_05415, partial [Actinomycetota bacterium]